MKGNKGCFPVLVLPLLAVLLFLAGPKRAMANGTLTATFIYNAGGTNQPLAGAYAYLHVYPQGAPIMEKYFRPAQYILGPSNANGNFSVSVPAGQYRVMLMARAPLTNGVSAPLEYGPPNTGDYVWDSKGSVSTVTDGSTTDLGTLFAEVFSAPVTITGTATSCNWVANSSGTYYCAPGSALSGRFVFATTAPCPFVQHGDSPDDDLQEYYCKPDEKYPAPAPTDASGHYTLRLPAAGTYYVYCGRNPGQTGRGYSAFPGPTAGAKPCGMITGPTQYLPRTNVVNPLAVKAGGTYTEDCNWCP